MGIQKLRDLRVAGIGLLPYLLVQYLEAANLEKFSKDIWHYDTNSQLQKDFVSIDSAIYENYKVSADCVSMQHSFMQHNDNSKIPYSKIVLANTKSKQLYMEAESTISSNVFADSHSNPKLHPQSNTNADSMQEFNTFAESQDSKIQSFGNQGIFIQGGVEIFNRTSFTVNQRVPSNSYGYFLGELNLGYNYKNFQFVIGGVGAGLSHDSTKHRDGIGLGFNYVGLYPGYLTDKEATHLNTHNYFIHNAFIAYKNSLLTIKAGRFLQEDDDWYDSYAEGAIAIVKFAKNYYLKLFGSSTYALVGYGWLNDFSRTYFKHGLLNTEIGYENERVKAAIYTYYGIKEFISPGFNVELSFGNSNKIASTTKLTAIFPIHENLVNNTGFFTNIRNSNGFNSSVLLREDITFLDKYLVALAFYKNIGNANARMAIFGNPLGIDIWDNSVYTAGTSLNASVAPDAFSVLLFTQAQYKNITKFLHSLSVGINGRYTTSPSSDEYSLILTCNLSITDSFSLSLILNYYTTIIKNEEWILQESMRANVNAATFDRSYLMTRIAYNF